MGVFQDDRLRLHLSFGMVAAVLLAAVAGCPARTRMEGARRDTPLASVRDIRVRIVSQNRRVRFRVNGPFNITADRRRSIPVDQSQGWIEVHAKDRILLGGKTTGARRVDVSPDSSARVEFSRWADGRWGPLQQFAGKLVFLARSNNRFDVINYVDLDTYLIGVLPKELYPDFHREAFRAQAVAARTYALYEMSRRTGSSFDVTAGEGSQVYGGIATGPAGMKAREAVEYTRGIVCTWSSPAGERIFCTYYSSACGGISQSVADAKHKPEIPPLSGQVKCNHCRIARGKAYRWGPVEITKKELFTRLVKRVPSIKELGKLDRMSVVSRTATGRLGRVRLVGTNRKTKDLYAEDFRLYAGSRTMRSTHCDLVDRGDRIAFVNGRGFGHGMGLCQWGTQGQALAGRSAAQILKFYYPGMHLTRAY